MIDDTEAQDTEAVAATEPDLFDQAARQIEAEAEAAAREEQDRAAKRVENYRSLVELLLRRKSPMARDADKLAELLKALGLSLDDARYAGSVLEDVDRLSALFGTREAEKQAAHEAAEALYEYRKGVPIREKELKDAHAQAANRASFAKDAGRRLRELLDQQPELLSNIPVPDDLPPSPKAHESTPVEYVRVRPHDMTQSVMVPASKPA